MITLTNCVITAYCLASSSNNKCADNKHYPTPNHTISIGDRSSIALGSKIVWRGTTYYGEDKMNRRYDGTHRFDIFFNTKQEVIDFGKQLNQTVIIYE